MLAYRKLGPFTRRLRRHGLGARLGQAVAPDDLPAIVIGFERGENLAPRKILAGLRLVRLALPVHGVQLGRAMPLHQLGEHPAPGDGLELPVIAGQDQFRAGLLGRPAAAWP